jgi:hypothetical protein
VPPGERVVVPSAVVASGDFASRALAPRLPRTQVPVRRPSPEGRVWRYLSYPVAAAMVICALVLIQGSA